MSVSATATKTAGSSSIGAGAKKNKGGTLMLTPGVVSTNDAKVVDELLANVSDASNKLDNFALAAAHEKDAKRRVERELEVERSRFKTLQQKDRRSNPTAEAGGKSPREQEVLDVLAQLEAGIDGAENNFKKSREQQNKLFDEMRAKADTAEVARRQLEEELKVTRANAEVNELSRKKLEGELSAARAEVDKLTAKVKEDYEEHVSKEQMLRDMLNGKEELLKKVISGLRAAHVRLNALLSM
ncbi:hypothetical protein VTI28DRAFT_6958 [Corynascus sepedonium]